MELHQLKSLASLARTRNLTRTAEQLHLTPSAVHRHLKLLTEELGVQLYEKHGSSLRISSAGRSLLPLVNQLLAQSDAIAAAAEDLRGLSRGTVRVGAGPAFCSNMLPTFLERFREQYPKLDVFLEAGHTTQLAAELEEGLVDLLFLVPNPGAERRFVVEKEWLFSVPLVTRPDAIPSRKVALRSLAGRPFLLYKQGSHFEEEIDRYMASKRFSPNVAMRLDNAEPIKAMLRSGFGISLLPDWAIQQELARKELALVPLRDPPLRCRIALMRRHTAYVSAPVAALIAMAKSWRW
jgi:DNA-binding transcriptional LysR family regulator